MRYTVIVTASVLGLAWLVGSGQPAAPDKTKDQNAPEVSREQAAIKQLIERGGKHWSAPARATIGGTEHQAGRHLFIWPAEDRVYPSVRNANNAYLFGVKFNWALQPGEKLPPQNSGGQYYRYAPVALPKTLGWDFTKRLDERASRGSFDVLLGAETKLKGEQDYVFALFINARESVPASNFVKLRVRLPE